MHYSVLVIGNNIEEAMLPFHEYESTAYEEYVEEVDILEEVKNTVKENPNDTIKELIESYYGFPVVRGNINKKYKTGKYKYGYVLIDKEGKVVKAVQRTNPNSHWDGWEVGGRFSNQLITKSNVKTNSALKQDLDFEKMGLVEKQKAEYYYDSVAYLYPKMDWQSLEKCKQECCNQSDAFGIYGSQEVFKIIRSLDPLFFSTYIANWSSKKFDMLLLGKQDFVNAKRMVTPYAVLKDSEWYEKDMSKDEIVWIKEFDSLVDSVQDDELLTMVDCHV